MSRWLRSRKWWRARFPRVSGDEPDQAMKAYRFQEFSPRERG